MPLLFAFTFGHPAVVVNMLGKEEEVHKHASSPCSHPAVAGMLRKGRRGMSSHLLSLPPLLQPSIMAGPGRHEPEVNLKSI